MNIFLFTSVPLSPPWDQGDKNLAYTLTQWLPGQCFQILTSTSNPAPYQENLDAQRVYRTNRPSTLQKLWVLLWLFYRSFQIDENSSGSTRLPDLYHFIYQPTYLSSQLLRCVPGFRQRPILHTVPASTRDHHLSARLFYADYFVTLSDYGRRSLESQGLRNVIHIPQGIDVTSWEPVSTMGKSFKKDHGLNGKRILLYPGHYTPGYGIHTLVNALPQIVSQDPEVVVIFACRMRHTADLAHEQELKKRLDQMGLTQAVRFLRTVADMRGLIGACDLLVLPFRTMHDKVDIPTTILEALAAGKPVVISNIPPMNEVFHWGTRSTSQNLIGIPIQPDDSDALAQAVASLLSNEELRQQMGQAGQDLARSHFDIQLIARRYEQLYQEMVL